MRIVRIQAGSMMTYNAGRIWISYLEHVLNIVGRSPERKMTSLTGANTKLNMNTRCEVNITRKYHVASFAIVSIILGTLSFLDVLAK